MAENGTRGYAIGELAGWFGLSRSTPLYFDRIGRLRPARRTAANYRRYSEADRERLERIRFYRKTGLALAEIVRVLAAPEDATTEILEDRLRYLEAEIRAMEDQRNVLLKLLRSERPPGRFEGMDRDGWTALLREVGLDDAAMRKWHREFERRTPAGHRDFLCALGIPEDEANAIRVWSVAEDSDGERAASDGEPEFRTDGAP